jgi:hypothetical protein
MISVTDVHSTVETNTFSEDAPQNLNQTNVLYPHTPIPLPGRISCDPIIYHPPCQRSPEDDVALLDKAEALAEDAFRKVSPLNPNPSFIDKLEAQLEMQEAQQIRNEVRPDLNSSQQQTLDQLNSEEQQAVSEAANPDGSNSFLQIFKIFDELAKMTDGEQKSRSLDNSILGFPDTPPISWPPIFPFGQIS